MEIKTEGSGSGRGGGWRAGVSRILITPREPIRLAGFNGREEPSSELRQDIYARALALRDGDGNVSVILGCDLLGFTRAMADEIAERAFSKFGLPRHRLVLNATHNHSAPVTGDLLHLYFDLEEAERPVIARYTAWVTDRLVEAIGSSLRHLEPVELAWGHSLAGFGVNRRRARPNCRHLPGPVDHDVPVLRVSGEDGNLLAIVFGYACHATASNAMPIHGDYPGFAQVELEDKYPGVTALFVTGCAGDINPFPRFRHESPQLFGHLLAEAVDDALQGPLRPVAEPLSTSYCEVVLPLQPPIPEAELRARLAVCHPTERRVLEYAIGYWQRGEPRQSSCAFPIQVWAFGDELLWIWLTAEPVVDYSLRFKAIYGHNRTWVSGYCNELLAYIPSRRVLEEGGYEGTEGMLEYGLPAPFCPEVEQIIVDAVSRMTDDMK